MNPSLDQLRDIHLPEEISWWSPAPGWWLLIGAILLLAAAITWWYRRRLHNRWRRLALLELAQLSADADHSHAQNNIKKLSVLLRRVAISRFPRKEVAGLNGQAWLEFLDQTLGERVFSEQGQWLVVGPYALNPEASADTLPALLTISERWIRTLPLKVKK